MATEFQKGNYAPLKALLRRYADKQLKGVFENRNIWAVDKDKLLTLLRVRIDKDGDYLSYDEENKMWEFAQEYVRKLVGEKARKQMDSWWYEKYKDRFDSIEKIIEEYGTGSYVIGHIETLSELKDKMSDSPTYEQIKEYNYEKDSARVNIEYLIKGFLRLWAEKGKDLRDITSYDLGQFIDAFLKEAERKRVFGKKVKDIKHYNDIMEDVAKKVYKKYRSYSERVIQKMSYKGDVPYYKTNLKNFPGLYEQIINLSRYIKLDQELVKNRLDNSVLIFTIAPDLDREDNIAGNYNSYYNELRVFMPIYFWMDVIQKHEEKKEFGDEILEDVKRFMYKNKNVYVILAHEAVHALQREALDKARKGELVSSTGEKIPHLSRKELGREEYYHRDPFERGAIESSALISKKSPELAEYSRDVEMRIRDMANHLMRGILFDEVGLTPADIQANKFRTEEQHNMLKRFVRQYNPDVFVGRDVKSLHEIIKLLKIGVEQWARRAYEQPGQYERDVLMTPERMELSSMDVLKHKETFGNAMKKLVKIADKLDGFGFNKEAGAIDVCLMKLRVK